MPDEILAGETWRDLHGCRMLALGVLFPDLFDALRSLGSFGYTNSEKRRMLRAALATVKELRWVHG